MIKPKVKRKYTSRSEKEENFLLLENSAKLSAQHNYDANRSLIGAIFTQAFEDFIAIHKYEIKPPTKEILKRKNHIKNIDKQDRLETCIDFLDKNNPMFIYYCGLLDFDPDWMARKINNRIKYHYLNKADIYMRKKGFKKKKKIPLPVENIDHRNLYCSTRQWKNVNNKCPHDKEFYCELCLNEIAVIKSEEQKGIGKGLS